MVVLICSDCPRFQISPGALLTARSTLTAARTHAHATWHCVSVHDSDQVFTYYRLGQTVLCEKQAARDAA